MTEQLRHCGDLNLEKQNQMIVLLAVHSAGVVRGQM